MPVRLAECGKPMKRAPSHQVLTSLSSNTRKASATACLGQAMSWRNWAASRERAQKLLVNGLWASAALLKEYPMALAN
jgi:hypothetical protein